MKLTISYDIVVVDIGGRPIINFYLRGGWEGGAIVMEGTGLNRFSTIGLVK
jgi:hypothetical protein